MGHESEMEDEVEDCWPPWHTRGCGCHSDNTVKMPGMYEQQMGVIMMYAAPGQQAAEAIAERINSLQDGTVHAWGNRLGND